MRLVFKSLLAIIVIIVLLLTAVLFVNPVRKAVIDEVVLYANQTLQQQGIILEFFGKHQLGWEQLSFENLHIKDKHQTWLEIHGVQINWKLAPLWSGDIIIPSLQIASLNVLKQPELASNDNAIENQPPDTNNNLQIPSIPINIELQQIKVARITLNQQLYKPQVSSFIKSGQTLSDIFFGITGKIALLRNGNHQLNLSLIDSNLFEQTQLLDINVENRKLNLNSALNLKKTFYQWLDWQALGLPLKSHPETIQANFQAEGELSQLRTKSLINIDQIGSIKNQLAINHNNYETEIELELDQSLLDLYQLAHVDNYLELKVEFQINQQMLSLDSLNMNHALIEINQQGKINFNQQQLDIQSTLKVNDQNIRHFLKDSPLSFQISPLTLNISGPFNAPEAKINGLFKDIKTQQQHIESLQISAVLNSLNEAVRFKGNLAFNNVVASPLKNEDFKLGFSGDYQSRQLTLEQLSLQSKLLSALMKGNYDLAHQSGQFRLNIDDMDLAALSNQAVFADNKIQAEIHLPDAERIELDLKQQTRFRPSPENEKIAFLGDKVDLTAQVSMQIPSNQLELKQLLLLSNQQMIEGQGSMNFNQETIDFYLVHKIEDLSLFEPVLNQEIKGQANQTIKISGLLDDIKVRGVTKLDNLQLAEQQFDQIKLLSRVNKNEDLNGDLDVELVRDNETIHIKSPFSVSANTMLLENFHLIQKNNQLNANLNVNLDTQLIDGSLKADFKQLNDLNTWLPDVQLNGDAQLNVLFFPEDNKQLLTLDLISQNLQQQNRHLSQLNLKAKLFQKTQDKKSWDFDTNIALGEVKQDSQILLQAANIDVKGDEKTGYLNVEAKALDPLKNLKLNAQFKPVSQWFELKSLTADLMNQPLSLLKPSALSFKDKKNLSLTPLQLKWADSQFLLNAELQDSTIDAGLQIEHFPLNTLKQFMPQDVYLSSLVGNINADMQLKGHLNKPEISSKLNITQLSLDHEQWKKMPRADIISTINYQNHRVNGNATIRGMTKKAIELDYVIPATLELEPFKQLIHEDKDLKFSLLAEVELEEIKDWLVLDQQVIKGLVNTDVQLQGSIKSPELTGEITLTEGIYENGMSGTVLKNIHLKTTALEKNQLVTELSANDIGEGKIKATSNLQLDPRKHFPFSAQIDLSRLQLANNDELQLILSGNNNIQGDKRQLNIVSRMKLDEGQFYLANQVGADIPELEVIDSNQQSSEKSQTEEKSPPLDVNLDVEFVIAPQFYVRGRGLESLWEGQVDVKGNIEKPELSGGLGVKRGHFSFLQKRFSFRRGQINFYGSIPPKPQLDFILESKADDFIALLNIKGPAQKPKLELTSEPVIPQDEILARLLFDKDIKDLSAIQAVQLAAAVKNLASGGAGFADSTREGLGVDTLDVNTSGSVTAGKQISDKVYVEVESGFASGGSTVRVEMEMTDQITVESSVDQSSNTGFGVNWKFDY